MRWGRRARSWVPGRWRWRPGSARDWGCRPPRSPGCWASSGWASPLVGSRERSPRPAAARARRPQPAYQSLPAGARASPVVPPDETGWRVGGVKAWLWAFVGDQVTVYRVAGGRGYQDATQVLGEDYAGVLERDGWAPYRRFAHARHQSCLAHLLRRCRELVADADRGQARTPHAMRRILEHALTL